VQPAEFGPILRRLRLAAGLSQEALAERALISLRAVNALERGYRKAPHQSTIARLVSALEPSEELRAALLAAADRARRHDAHEEPRGAEPAGATHNLPRQLTSFVGRDAVVEDLTARIASAPLLTIVGTGGIGKTRVAINVAGRASQGRPDGAWFVDFSGLTEGDLVIPAVAAVLGVPDAPGARFLDTLLATLKNKRLLLVLDNCEHLLAEVARLAAAVLAKCDGVGILATSRERLGVAGETVYRMPALAVATHAVDLFVERARAVDDRFRLTAENAEAIGEICSVLDGIPLAIELAAPWTRTLAPEALADRLRERLDVLRSSDPTTSSRQRTMEGALEWSYALLSPPERCVFARMGAFASAFTLEAFEQVCAGNGIADDALLPALRSLVERSLVVSEPGAETTYRLLETTRRYALRRLRQGTDWAETVQKHGQSFVQLARSLDVDRDEGPEDEWTLETQRALDDWRAILARSLGERADVVLGQRLVAALSYVWLAFSAAEGLRWLRTALDLVEESTPAPVVANLYLAAALLQPASDQSRTSLAPSRRAIRALAAVGEPRETVSAWLALASKLLGLGRLGYAARAYQCILRWGRSNANERVVASALVGMGRVESMRGNAENAAGLFREALALAVSREWGMLADIASLNLAEDEFVLGRPAAALRIAEDALTRLRRRTRQQSVAHILSNIAAYLIALDRCEEALTRAQEVFRVPRHAREDVIWLYALQHASAAIALGGSRDGAQRVTAARILGFVDAALAAFGARREINEQREYDRAATALREALGPAKYAESVGHGAGWTADEAAACGATLG
jgi:predicted ATPase/transcriptional regulator with XRE-family HTH domain